MLKGWFFTTMPIDQLVNLSSDGYYFRMSNRYWLVTDKDEVIFFGNKRSPYHSPQCNLNPGIGERLKKGPAEQGIVVTDVRLIPVAFQPIQISDFQ